MLENEMILLKNECGLIIPLEYIPSNSATVGSSPPKS